MPDTIIESVLNGKLNSALLIKWLNNESIEDAPDDCILLCCAKSEFVAYFLTYLRNQTDSILQTNSNAVQILHNATPEKLLSTRRKHRRSTSEPTSDERTDSLSVKDSRSHHESPNRDKKRTGRKVKTKLFSDDKNISNISVSSDESRLSTGVDRIAISSTPMKNGLKPTDFPSTSPVTPRSCTNSYERCDTPRLSHRHTRSHEKSCLGDYLATAIKSSKKKNKKNTSNENETDKIDLDLSNSEIFPEIGARKSSSLRSERRRIKPTNIDKSQKSLSLNSFNLEPFHQQSPLALEDNSAQTFQPKESTNSFEVERSLLKQERHKLMEKFNILNTSTPTKAIAMPQIKITQKESIEITQSYIKADVTKILLKDKIESLIEIYDLLLKNNLILSVNTEIYFLISILMSKQLEDDYLNVESKLNDDNMDFLLKSIHNSTYFAVKALWNQKVVLEVILDKNSLKTLGENKKVRSFYPELAKFLLNCYCVRCERPAPRAPLRAPAAVVNYNYETDSADNFPTTHAFHLFKKQRDAFYDIIRWYQDTVTTGGSRTSFRARVKTLLSHGATAANHAHLAALFAAHMLAQCLPSDAQESKLSKLQRRLTCPAATESNRLPHFTDNEMFYKEFISHAENESFRVHLRDVLATEIVILDGTHIAIEDRSNSNNLDLTREYLQLAKKLALLAKFLGYLTSLPYSQVPTEITNKSSNNVVNTVITNSRELNYSVPKEKVLENNIALRNYSQPTIDLKGLLQTAHETSRLSITIPWLVHYLSMLDYTTLRLKYYNELIKTLFEIYFNKLKLTQIDLKKNTVIYLKSVLGWLFDLGHFPNDEVRYNSVVVKASEGVDACDLVDESTIIELCPSLKDVNTLLATCRLSQEQKDMGSFRHITPVSLSVNPEDRIKNKEKELQARLEEELLKSQPSSTRRVLEMVVERVTSAAVKEITARELVVARERARELARRALAASAGESHSTLLQTTTSIYTGQLHSLRSTALSTYRAALLSRSRAALLALLPLSPPHVCAVAARMATRALSTWLQDHTNTTAILCKDIEAEMRSLISLNEMNISHQEAANEAGRGIQDVFRAMHCSVATPLIHLKEHICILLEGGTPADVTSLLATSALSCSPANVCRRAPAQRAMLHLTVDLCLVYVSKKPQEITESFLNKLHAIWNTICPDRKHYAPEEVLVPERRDDISPQLRNFEDDERMATPISDEEMHNSKTVNGTDQPLETIASTSQPANPIWQAINAKLIDSQPQELQQPSTSQPFNPKWQPINTKLQPINTKSQPVAKSQPASPMLQPISHWQITSRSQPVSPKQPISPKLQKVIPNQQLIRPKVQPINLKVQPINLKVQPTSPIKDSSEVKDQNADSEHLLECFDRILCPRNIALLSSSTCLKSEVWEALATVLVFLLKNDYLSEDSLTEQCLAVYRQDWPQNILESLSTCMKSVSARWSRSLAGKFTLFLDFLAEYCGDMDYEPLE